MSAFLELLFGVGIGLGIAYKLQSDAKIALEYKMMKEREQNKNQ